MTVELVQLLEFANLTPALQIYVWTAAAHRYQQGTVGSAALDSFSVEDVQNAMADAVNEDFENSDANIINDKTGDPGYDPQAPRSQPLVLQGLR
jgi:hypothetical protein